MARNLHQSVLWPLVLRVCYKETSQGVWGYSPSENFEKMGYLRPHFVRFEDSLLGNKPYKGEGSKENNSGTFLNLKHSFRNNNNK